MNLDKAKYDEGLEKLSREQAPVGAKANLIASQFSLALERRSSRWVVAAAGLAAVSLGVFSLAVLTSKPAFADQIKQIVDAGKNSPNRIERRYELASNGSWELKSTTWISESGWHSKETGAAETFVFGDKIAYLFDSYATVCKQKNGNLSDMVNFHTFEQLVKQASPNNVSVKRETAASNGQSRYSVAMTAEGNGTVEATFDGSKQGGSSVSIVADKNSSRPSSMTVNLGKGKAIKLTWEYPSTPPEQARFSVPPGTQIYDLDAQRSVFLSSLSKPSSVVEANGEKIGVVGAYLDHSGALLIFTTGDAGCSADGPNLRVGDSELETSGFAWTQEVNQVQQPADYNGVKITARRYRLTGNVVELKDVQLPILLPGGATAFVSLPRIPIVRTGSVISLFMPENVPFWETASGGSPTSGG